MDHDSLAPNQAFISSFPYTSTSSQFIATYISPTIYLKSICPWNVDALKKIHLTLFPVHYSDSFYYQLQNEGEFAKLVYLDGVAVGSVCSRLERDPKQQEKNRVYIMTLGVLEHYRRRHLGHFLLQHIIDQAQLQPTITQIYLHVQTVNTAALAFYHQHGFREVALVRGYYRLANNNDAYVVVRNINHGQSSPSVSSTISH
ncbi:acyl-CoA N-acyltransferase, partial [Absidia repens]